MNSLSQELAVTRITDANAAFCRDGRSNNNIFIWVIIFVIFFIFNGDGFGFGGSNNQCCCKRCRRRRHRCRDNNDNGLDGIFGGNGWFILIIFAVLFLFNDGGANTNIINVDTDDAQI